MRALRLFEGFGLELEYMLVDTHSLSVLPRVDRVLHAVAGEYIAEVERGALAWSNELANHVIELKTNGPAPALRGLDEAFARDVEAIHDILVPENGRLMPTAAHPWMDPPTETKLWPHEDNEIYSAFDRIFGCKGHGWANVQCSHLNLPFHGDAEFARLHAAVRLVLPLIPAIAASSPILDSRITGTLDTRLHIYRDNQKKIPSITGLVIPEPVYTQHEYEERIMEPMYADIAPYDPEGTLHNEWLNARGAIARFDRETIEIRIIDSQEGPTSDLAVIHAIVCALRAHVGERWIPLDRQKRWETAALNRVLLATTRDAESALIEDADYLAAFGLRVPRCRAGDLWRHLVETVVGGDSEFGERWSRAITAILDRGTLASRIVRAVAAGRPAPRAGAEVAREDLRRVYRELCDCLEDNRVFDAPR